MPESGSDCALDRLPTSLPARIGMDGHGVYYSSISLGDLNFRSENHISAYVVLSVRIAKTPATTVTRYLPRL